MCLMWPLAPSKDVINVSRVGAWKSVQDKRAKPVPALTPRVPSGSP